MSIARRRASLVLVASLAVLMTGCLRAEQRLTLNQDDTVDGTITIAVSEQLIELAGSSADEVIDQVTEGDSPLPEGVDAQIDDYDQDGFVGKTFTFTGASLDQINEQGDLTIVRQGDAFVVDGQIDMSTGAEQIDPNDPTTQGLLEEFEVSVSVTFPGAVTEHDGSLDGTTVTWTPAFGENTTIHAEGSAIGGGSSSWMTWVLAGLGVLLLVVVVLIVVMRGRRGDRDAATPETPGPAEAPEISQASPSPAPQASSPPAREDSPPVAPDRGELPEPPSPR